MSTYNADSQKRTGHELTNTEVNALQSRGGAALDSGACYVGIDAEQRIHIIDRVHGAGVAVFDDVGDTDPTVVRPADNPAARTPGEWADYIQGSTGWHDCAVVGFADQ